MIGSEPHFHQSKFENSRFFTSNRTSATNFDLSKLTAARVSLAVGLGLVAAETSYLSKGEKNHE
jgi:hypothetical protein